MDLRGFRRARVNGLYVENLDRLVWILREKYPKVLEADRRFEEETLYRNKLGTNNLVDALSHIGTLFESAPGATRDEQRAQITLFEDHLRRTMMEAWEQMLDFQLGEIDEMWQDEYLKLARPLQIEGRLPGAPTHHEIDKLRMHYRNQLDRGRAMKRGPNWDAWEEGTDLLIDACLTASQLREKLTETIAAAKKVEDDKKRDQQEQSRHQQTMRRDTVNKMLTIAGLIIALIGGGAIGALIRGSGNSSGPRTRSPSVSAPAAVTTTPPPTATTSTKTIAAP